MSTSMRHGQHANTVPFVPHMVLFPFVSRLYEMRHFPFFPMTTPAFSNMCLPSGQISQTVLYAVISVPHVTKFISDMNLILLFLSVVSSPAQISCPPLTAPAHGKKFGSKYLVGHEVHFTCPQGYRLVGTGTRVCQENGTWSGATVICKGQRALMKSTLS